MRDDWSGTLNHTPNDSQGAPRQSQSPRFCPGCNRPRSATHSDLCAECGDRLEPQGYCPVCEAFWPIAVESPCPKHELALAPSPPEPSYLLTPDGPIDWVTVSSFQLPFQAEAARLRLDAEEIPTLLEGHRMAAHGYHLATGGIRLQVPRSLAQDARIILSQNWSVPSDADFDTDDDDWPDSPPLRDEFTRWRSTLIFWGVVFSLLVVLAGLLGVLRA